MPRQFAGSGLIAKYVREMWDEDIYSRPAASRNQAGKVTEWSTLIGQDTVLWLVEIIVLQRQLSYTIEAPKAPY